MSMSPLLARAAVWAFLAILNSACSTGTGVSTAIDIRSPAFSSDSKTLFFDFCKGSECDLVAYSLEEQRFSRIVPVEEELRFSSASMANHPALLAGVLRYRKAEFTAYPQIVLIDLDSDTYRRLTNDPSHKSSPSLSFDDKSVAFIQSHRQRTWFNGDPRATGWDIHILDIASGANTRATNYCFYGLGKPFIAPDNGDLIFSGEGPMCNYPEPGVASGKKDYKEYKERFGEDDIVRLGPIRKRLEPWFQTEGRQSSSPRVARNGDVLFSSRTNLLDGIQKGYYNYDIFLKRGEEIRRLTWLKSLIEAIALSPNSAYAAYVSDPGRHHQFSLWLLNIETGESKQVALEALLSETRSVPVRRIAGAQ